MFGKNAIFCIILFVFLISISNVTAADYCGGETIKMNINNHTFDVELENNSATQELLKKLNDDNISVSAHDYGNFEKVADLGFLLPATDEKVTTAPGDIVLYQGNQISLFYESHSWSYTKLGKIQNVTADELKDILGSGDVRIVLSLE